MCAGLLVRELTGDMQLTQRKTAETHMIVIQSQTTSILIVKQLSELL